MGCLEINSNLGCKTQTVNNSFYIGVYALVSVTYTFNELAEVLGISYADLSGVRLVSFAINGNSVTMQYVETNGIARNTALSVTAIGK